MTRIIAFNEEPKGRGREEEGLNNSILKMVCGMRVLSLQVSVLCMPETGNVKQKAVVM